MPMVKVRNVTTVLDERNECQCLCGGGMKNVYSKSERILQQKNAEDPPYHLRFELVRKTGD